MRGRGRLPATFFKVKPPFCADEDDRLAMVEAVRTGLIDVICSMHTPQDEESKRLPFEGGGQAGRWGFWKRCCPRRCAFTMPRH